MLRYSRARIDGARDVTVIAKYDHNYSEYFAQALSNPQPAYCYPDEALAEFCDWTKKEYMMKKMLGYLLGKVKQGRTAAPAANVAPDAFNPKKLPLSK